jgi:hypothetical protein
VAPHARANSTVRSELPPSTTITSSGPSPVERIARATFRSSFSVGTITLRVGVVLVLAHECVVSLSSRSARRSKPSGPGLETEDIPPTTVCHSHSL